MNVYSIEQYRSHLYTTVDWYTELTYFCEERWTYSIISREVTRNAHRILVEKTHGNGDIED